MDIKLNGPKTVTLSPQTLAVILDALSELTLKVALPAFNELVVQLKDEKDASKLSGEGG